jgi:tetratricopeptide (TPR) repeat protein
LELAVASAPNLRDDAIRLYASGQFPRACEHFSRAAADVPSTAASQDLARCFEGWGWQALRDGRADEARLLFSQGLSQIPDDAGLLRGLGVAAIHGGRPADAVDPLERAVGAGADAEVRLLLARLYDQRDNAERALYHIKTVLDREPDNAGARRLLEKVERERTAEAGFRRELTPHFIIKHRSDRHRASARAVAQALEAAWARIGSELGWRPGERVTVVLYEDVQFRRVTRVHGWVTGVFDGKIRLPIEPTAPPPDVLERLVMHEYAHAAVHELSRGRAPRWLHEGLAQLLEGATADPMLRVPGGLTLVGLEALITDPDPVRARVGYDVALWVVQDLVDRGGLARLRRVLERLGAGDTLAASMTRVYGVRLSELESQWRNLLGG